MESRLIENSMSQKKTALIELMKDGIPRSAEEMSLIIDPSRHSIYDATLKKYLKELIHNDSVKLQFVRRKGRKRAEALYFMSSEEGRKLPLLSLGCKNMQTDRMIYKIGCDECFYVRTCESYEYLFKNSNG